MSHEQPAGEPRLGLQALIQEHAKSVEAWRAAWLEQWPPIVIAEPGQVVNDSQASASDQD